MMMKLESILEGLRVEVSLSDRVRTCAKAYIANTFSNITFYQPIMFAYELCRGVSVRQSLDAREDGTVLALAGLGLVQGVYRNLWYWMTRTTKASGAVRRGVVEAVSAGTLQLPIYTEILQRSGVEDVQGTALLGVAICVALSPILGWYQNRVRQQFGIRAAHEYGKRAA